MITDVAAGGGDAGEAGDGEDRAQRRRCQPRLHVE